MAKKRSQKAVNKKASTTKKAETPKSKESTSKPLGSNLSPLAKNSLVHGGLILGFFLIVLMYFSPILSGETLFMGDIRQFAGMTQQVKDFRAETGEEAFWTSRMFGGMPTYHAGLQYPNNIIRNIYSVYFKLFPPPVSFIFLMFLGVYLLLNTLKTKPLYSFLGAAAFAFSSYFFIIMEAGHTTKAAAIGFMAPIVAGILMIYRGNWLTGGLVTAFFMAFNLCANHVQITYYMGIMVLIIGLALFVDALRKGTFVDFAKSSAVALLAVGLGIAPNFGQLYTSYEYMQETIRGKSELTAKDGSEKPQSGLDRDYAFDWDYEIEETFTLLVPNFMGGSSQTTFDRGSKNYEIVRKNLGANNARRPMPTFWGNPIFTSGPVYVGAIVCFLFALGLGLVKGPFKWGLLAATIIFIMFSWGDNLEWFNYFIFDTVPLYNKFRAVSMALVIPEFTMPILGALGLYQLLNYEKNGWTKAEVNRVLYIAGGVTGGLCLILAVMGTSLFDFTGTVDQQYLNNQNGQQLVDVFVELRKNMLVADAWRSFGLIAVAFGLLWAYINSKGGALKNATLILGILAALTIGDLWMVNKRYVNNEDFSKRDNYEAPSPSPASSRILQDPSHYRVLNLTVNSWNNANTAFFHNDIGGYHPAKLRRYNDLIQNRLSAETNMLRQLAGQGGQQPPLQAFQNLHSLNMLNGKYIIVGPNQYWRNPAAMGNAWFVNSFDMVQNADEEIAALQNLNPRLKAVVDKRYDEKLQGYTFRPDSAASIRLTNFSPNEISYQSTSATDQLAIFSEVYYNNGKGWNCYVDGERVDHIRANYVLRALPLKAGNHQIVFKMEPASYRLGETISLVSSLILIVVALAAAGLAFMRYRQEQQAKTE